MTSSEQNHGKRGQDDVLAGEYVLGVLSNEKRRQVEQRMLHDKEFALLERFRFSLNRMRFPNQFCSDSLMLAGWRPALDDRTDIE
ncbi:hypothetical protein BLA27_27280 [Brucella cytisi]|uniref:Uncharacterized protein n=2 Tax=Brucella cytisi TaxID=407152 RepID=A0A1J6HB59_9HYPH|nr:hypothetical protein BLA27_27280 [Brucella cytisi]